LPDPSTPDDKPANRCYWAPPALYFGDFTPHIPLAFGIAITALLGVALGRTWRDLEGGIFHVINVSLPSVSILIIVGMLIGTWIAAGTVPSLIYYGLILLSPEVFLAAAMILCAVVSVSLGTSWGTVGTVGLALMGIGAGFGIPPYWTAGAVVSGAFFGDKVSPLSDTTNLAPAVTGAKLFDHIKNLMPTTVPAKRSRAAAPSCRSATSVSATATSGTASLPSSSRRSRLARQPAAPAATAAPAKSWPSRSATSGTNSSPARSVRESTETPSMPASAPINSPPTMPATSDRANLTARHS